MKRTLAVVFSLLSLSLSPPLFAQAPPAPLDEDLLKWMVGNWEGTTEGTMGKMADEMEIDWDLEHQFIGLRYKSKTAETDPAKLEAMAKTMGLTKEQLQMPYKGKGVMTMNPQTKEYIGYWFGSMRDISQGKGVREGNKITMTWEGTMGNEVRTIEKAGDDKLVMSFKGKDAQGNDMSGTTTLMRKVKKEKGAKKS
jgi:hypothetical protein